MLFIFFHTNILAVLAKSLLKTDCYMSFSSPPIYIKISHYYPSGPIYLYASFSTYRHSNIPGESRENADFDLHFKRLDDKCKPSVLFSIIGSDFKYLYISIFLRLHIRDNIFAEFSYKFLKGFKPGIYEMFDEHQNFLIHCQILDVDKNYLKVPISLNQVAKFYLNSISGQNSEVCVITENNRAVILKPNYVDNASHGFVKLLSANIYKYEQLIGIRTYPAFECNKNETYPEEVIMLIIDGKNYHVDLYVIDIFLMEKKLKLSKKEIYYVKNFKNIPTGYKKLFLIKNNIDITTCPDRSEPIFYISNDNQIYYVKVYQEIYISSWIEFSCYSFRTPSNMCGINN